MKQVNENKNFRNNTLTVVTINNKDIYTIRDILLEARSGGMLTVLACCATVSAKDSNLEIEMDSVMRIYNGQLDLTYHRYNGCSRQLMVIRQRYEFYDSFNVYAGQVRNRRLRQRRLR